MEQSAGVRAALLRFYAAFSSGDPAQFERTLSGERDGLVIGTAPTEWFEGRDRWLGAYQEQIAALPGIRLEPGDPRAWEQVTVGWAADRPRFVLPDGSVIEGRVTVVALQEEGEWRLVQAHFSVGIADEDAAQPAR